MLVQNSFGRDCWSVMIASFLNEEIIVVSSGVDPPLQGGRKKGNFPFPCVRRKRKLPNTVLRHVVSSNKKKGGSVLFIIQLGSEALIIQIEIANENFSFRLFERSADFADAKIDVAPINHTTNRYPGIETTIN